MIIAFLYLCNFKLGWQVGGFFWWGIFFPLICPRQKRVN